MIGGSGEVVSWGETSGRILLDGELWEAQSSQRARSG